jgi:hypothetical protein
MRFRTREEQDARFEINDPAGCWFSFEPWAFNVTNVVATNECEIRLCVVRDEITKPIYSYNSPGIVARLLYDRSASATNVTIYLFYKSEGTNTYGLQLYQSSAMTFVAGEPLRLFVNQTNTTVVYAGTTNTVTHTNLAVNTWVDGAVCAVEAENNGGVDYVDMDNFKAWRPDAAADQDFSAVFTNSPNGMTVLSEPEKVTMLNYWAPSRYSESYITNGSVIWFPKEEAGGSSWISPRRDYQNDVRLPLTTANVVEVSSIWRNFASGYGKICLLPELLTGKIFDDYTTNALYVQLERSGTNILFTPYRHFGPGEPGRSNICPTVTNAYWDGWTISLQVSANTLQVYYGTNQMLSASHGLTNALQVFANGAFPHMEIQNYSSPTINSILIDSVGCRSLSEFGGAEP